ncbi:hypothetical protein IQ235_08865 [Oscillatoriales cyanobacterium LEGE 11467]|uniref:DUF4352 domain-containing protein n=1 Tax=Zarconia navalis LEGE 11467 TaxID=1828826 RepID=A0A928VZ78_9CYAN|nr:hypothetical protein [Zarconia navalis]MBE9040888.1 hypothetical protein [Zarconia navalis LEGE 11467]
MKLLPSSYKLRSGIAIAVASTILLLGSCNSSKSDPSETSEREVIQSATSNPDRSKNIENATSQPSESSNTEETEAETLVEDSLLDDDSTEEAEIVELPDFVDETAQGLDRNSEESEVEETQPETADETTEPVETESRSIPENRTIEVEDFDFQLRQVSVENEIVDRASNKRLSAENADEPSSYLLVELDLKNNSDEVMWDSVLYTLECGDGNVIENAADVARVYRSNQNIKISSEIPPGGKGLVADAFLVPEYCLKSDGLNLIVSPVGKGKATIPLNLE